MHNVVIDVPQIFNEVIPLGTDLFCTCQPCDVNSSVTFLPCLTAWTIISITVVVFPVPGGPCTIATSG